MGGCEVAEVSASMLRLEERMRTSRSKCIFETGGEDVKYLK